MDKFMHKVKEAISSHHDENKESSQGSSNIGKRDDYDTKSPSNNAQGSHNMGSEHQRSSDFDTDQITHGDTDNVYGSNNQSFGNDGSLANKLDNTRDTYGSNTVGKEGFVSGGLGADNADTGDTYGDNTYSLTNTGMNSGLGSDTKKSTGQNMGGYGGLGPDPHKDPDYTSSNMGGYGSAVNDVRDLDKKIGMDTTQDLDDRGGFGNTTTVTGNSGFNSHVGPNSNTMCGSGNTDSVGQHDFGGTAGGGSSYNSPEPGKRRLSGPHKSKFLNSLDPRVHKSDYVRNADMNEGNMVGNQRGS
ncbi:hypothetical protein N7495_008483 [Penicillium taxi]|uniref:uncharacterized protein n=1 Tax=Penicillium taxi TaxID=168475 RepID=UPI002544EF0F|nr:uncharacterized protein N7495_008483 [Penicillium taxi]KAJ5888442.1 hypothetical protein N7495_008483 [Penicillium taxi]